MAKEKTEERLVPEIKPSAKSELLNQSFDVQQKPGHYLLEQPDGVLINVTPRTYERAYKNLEGFKVKKSPNQ